MDNFIKYSLRPKLFGLYSILGCPKIISCLKSQTPLIYYHFLYALNLFVGAFFLIKKEIKNLNFESTKAIVLPSVEFLIYNIKI